MYKCVYIEYRNELINQKLFGKDNIFNGKFRNNLLIITVKFWAKLSMQ